MEMCTQPIWLPPETSQNELVFPKTYTHKARVKTKENNNIMEARKQRSQPEKAKNLAHDNIVFFFKAERFRTRIPE